MSAQRITAASVASALIALGAQYLTVTMPKEQALDRAERLLDKRESRIERREARIDDLEDALEQCRGESITRGYTRGLVRRAQEGEH